MLLHDMKQSADRITRYANGRTFDDFVADDYFRSAVECQFEIVGTRQSLGGRGNLRPSSRLGTGDNRPSLRAKADICARHQGISRAESIVRGPAAVMVPQVKCSHTNGPGIPAHALTQDQIHILYAPQRDPDFEGAI